MNSDSPCGVGPLDVCTFAGTVTGPNNDRGMTNTRQPPTYDLLPPIITITVTITHPSNNANANTKTKIQWKPMMMMETTPLHCY